MQKYVLKYIMKQLFISNIVRRIGNIMDFLIYYQCKLFLPGPLKSKKYMVPGDPWKCAAHPCFISGCPGPLVVSHPAVSLEVAESPENITIIWHLLHTDSYLVFQNMNEVFRSTRLWKFRIEFTVLRYCIRKSCIHSFSLLI